MTNLFNFDSKTFVLAYLVIKIFTSNTKIDNKKNPLNKNLHGSENIQISSDFLHKNDKESAGNETNQSDAGGNGIRSTNILNDLPQPEEEITPPLDDMKIRTLNKCNDIKEGDVNENNNNQSESDESENTTNESVDENLSKVSENHEFEYDPNVDTDFEIKLMQETLKDEEMLKKFVKNHISHYYDIVKKCFSIEFNLHSGERFISFTIVEDSENSHLDIILKRIDSECKRDKIIETLQPFLFFRNQYIADTERCYLCILACQNDIKEVAKNLKGELLNENLNSIINFLLREYNKKQLEFACCFIYDIKLNDLYEDKEKIKIVFSPPKINTEDMTACDRDEKNLIDNYFANEHMIEDVKLPLQIQMNNIYKYFDDKNIKLINEPKIQSAREKYIKSKIYNMREKIESDEAKNFEELYQS
ncbi:hypothetical protein COBT_001793, partial [Conglomerata obtusa]